MFGSNRAFLNKIDELEQRSVELARALDKTEIENKELKEIRLISEHNNTVLVKKNQKQDDKDKIENHIITLIKQMMNTKIFKNYQLLSIM